MKNKQLSGIIMALGSGVCWGFSGTVGQFLFTTRNVDTGWLTTIRLTVSGIILLAFSLLKKDPSLKTIWSDKKTVLHLLFFALTGLMLVQYSYMQAIYYSNSGTATALQYSGEALVLVYTCIVGRRLPKAAEALGLALALTGIFLLTTHGNIHTLVLTPIGITWALISAVTLMIYTVVPGSLIKRFGNSAVTGYGMFIGGMLLALLLKFWTLPASDDPVVILGLAAIICVGTILAYSLFLISVTLIGPLKAGLLSSIETVAAPLISFLWLKTPFVTVDIIGFALITIMVIMFALPALLEQKKSAE